MRGATDPMAPDFGGMPSGRRGFGPFEGPTDAHPPLLALCVVALVLIALVTAAVWWWRHRRRRDEGGPPRSLDARFAAGELDEREYLDRLAAQRGRL